MKRKITLAVLLFLFSLQTFSQAPNWLWGNSGAGTGSDQGNSIAVDAGGNSYITGQFVNASITFGTTTLTNTGGYDIFIAKYDAAGNSVWAVRAGGTGPDYGFGIAADTSGNVYVTGYFGSSSITFGSITLSSPGLFIVKYDASGNAVWATGASGGASSNAIAVDGNGNSYIAGDFNGFMLTFGSTTIYNTGGNDFFIAKCDSTGNPVWLRGGTGTGFDIGLGIAADDYGNSFVTGSFGSDTLFFTSDTLINAGTYNIFTAKYDAAGNVVWARSAGGTDTDEGRDIEADSFGNCYLTGSFKSNTIAFGSTTIINASGNNTQDFFLAKYSASGNLLWAVGATPTNGGEGGYGIAVDANDNCYALGYFSCTSITFGATTLINSSGYSDIFVCKYNSSGTPLWATRAGGTLGDFPKGIALQSGISYVTGYFNSPSVFFGTSVVTNTGGSDVFVAKLDSALSISTVINGAENSADILFFPNPFTTTATIKFYLPLHSAIFRLYNLYGQLVAEKRNISGTSLDITRDNLAGDVYVYEVTDKEKKICTGKAIIY